VKDEIWTTWVLNWCNWFTTANRTLAYHYWEKSICNRVYCTCR